MLHSVAVSVPECEVCARACAAVGLFMSVVVGVFQLCGSQLDWAYARIA
jgi:hypothetical protein